VSLPAWLGVGGDFSGCGENFGDDGVDVRFDGAVVDDTGAQRKVAVDGGVGQVDAAATNDSIENTAVEVVQVERSWVDGCNSVAETDGTEGDWGQALEHWFGVDCVGEDLGEVEVLANGLLKCAKAEVAQ